MVILPGYWAAMSEEKFDLDRINGLLSQHNKTVAAWLEGAPPSNANKVKAETAMPVGRPPRLGIGAKPGSQKDRMQESVFVSPKLKMRLTGQERLDGPINEVNLKSFGGKKRMPQMEVKRKAADDDEDEGRSRSMIVPKKSNEANQKKRKQKK